MSEKEVEALFGSLEGRGTEWLWGEESSGKIEKSFTFFERVILKRKIYECLWLIYF